MTDESVDWSEIFFRLHKYCNLNKWDIWEYTLPQVIELLKSTDKHIQFQVEVQSMSMGAMFGVGGNGEEKKQEDKPSSDDGEYEVMDEEGLKMLTRALAGG